MKDNKIDDLLYHIYKKSFDYGIRDKAKLYYELVTNVEKPLLNTFLDNELLDFKSLNVTYGFIDFKANLSKVIKLEQSKEERLKVNIEDCGTAFFDQAFKQNIMLLSDYKPEQNYSNYVYKPIFSDSVNSMKLNEVISKENLTKIIEQVITPNDTVRLFINDEMIDDTDDATIDSSVLFKYEEEFKFKPYEEGGDLEPHNFANFYGEYFDMVNMNKFPIKLPINIYMTETAETMQTDLTFEDLTKVNYIV
jgi:hypothetical protein